MASKPTAKTVVLSPETTPGHAHAANLTEESAALTSKLLNINHERYHTRWKDTFHNHLTHHLLALWALGATPAEIQAMWEYNTTYQSPINKDLPIESVPDLDLKDPVVFESCLGNDDRYVEFLRFFEDEISAKGMEEVVKEYVLKGDERADDILARLFTDLVHPIIHLGCGIEFQQPSIVAEALAGACVHVNWPKTFLSRTEAYVKENPDLPSRSMLQMLDSLRSDAHIRAGVTPSDPLNKKIPEGLLKRVSVDELAPYLGQFQVKPEPEDLQRKLTDMMYTSAYVLAAAQQPGKRETLDFVTLHSVTLAVFFPAILAQTWLSDQEKARLLEAKVRVDAVMFAGCASPDLYPERVLQYKPQHPSDGWDELFHRANVYEDEGHAAKLIRALYSIEALGEPGPELPITKRDILLIAHMSMDSIELAVDEEKGTKVPEAIVQDWRQRMGDAGEMIIGNLVRWVFYGGIRGAWDRVPESEEIRS